MSRNRKERGPYTCYSKWSWLTGPHSVLLSRIKVQFSMLKDFKPFITWTFVLRDRGSYLGWVDAARYILSKQMLSKYFAWEDSFMMSSLNTVVEDYWNCLISQNCERSEQRLRFYWAKVHWKCQNGQFGEFLGKQYLAVKNCYQTGQLLIRQKFMENAKRRRKLYC